MTSSFATTAATVSPTNLALSVSISLSSISLWLASKDQGWPAVENFIFGKSLYVIMASTPSIFFASLTSISFIFACA